MLRLRFSACDLSRVRLRGTLGPLVETLLALQVVSRPARSAAAAGPPGEWRRRVLSRMPPAAVVARLMPPGWTAGDLFALIGPAVSVEQSLAVLRLGPLAGPSPPEVTHPTGRVPVGRLLGTRAPARPAGPDRLAALLAVSYDLGVAAHWPAMRAQLDAEHATRARILTDGGIDRLFATLHPALRWRSPVLELPAPPSHDVIEHDLAGRGLDVVPAVFCRGSPEFHLPADGGPGVLIYPAATDPAAVRPWESAAGDVPDGLADLIGQTRAAVLAALADGCTTGELARRLRISPAGASQHATVLRRAGLILSTRRGNSVLHTLTPLGTALLDGWPAR